MKVVPVLSILLLLNTLIVKGHIVVDYASSGYHLKQLIQHEKGLQLIFFENQLELEWKTIERCCNETLNQYTGGYEEESLTSQNPLHVYRLLRRHVIEWPFIGRKLKKENPESILNVKVENLVEDYTEKYNLPTVNDLNKAMQSILHLKQTFNLEMNEFTEDNSLFNCTLTSNRLLEIGLYAYKQEIYTHAIDFVYEGLKNQGDEYDDDLINEIIQKHDEKLQTKQSETSTCNENEEFTSSSYVFSEALVNVRSEMFPKRIRQVAQTRLLEKNNVPVIMSNFESLCRGEILRPTSSTRTLNCYNGRLHPYFTLCPVKVEVHYTNPPVIQFHDVLNENQLQKIIEKAEPNFKRSTISGESVVGDFRMKSNVRTSSNTWIFDDVFDSGSSEFGYLNAKVKMITGMETSSMSSVEFLQVASYLPGSHYLPHRDNVFEKPMLKYMPETEISRGDRIATFMLYLSEVKSGGSTVFPILGVAVKPVKGSALFWYNENPDGSMDINMLHAGCPVLLGDKIVGNKWIRSNDQMFIRHCPRDYFI